MPVDDKNFGADDYHTGNDQSYLKKSGFLEKVDGSKQAKNSTRAQI